MQAALAELVRGRLPQAQNRYREAVSLLPAVLGMSGVVYWVGALLLGLWYLYSGVRVSRERNVSNARAVLMSSIVYLPVLYGLMLLSRPGF